MCFIGKENLSVNDISIFICIRLLFVIIKFGRAHFYQCECHVHAQKTLQNLLACVCSKRNVKIRKCICMRVVILNYACMLKLEMCHANYKLRKQSAYAIFWKFRIEKGYCCNNIVRLYYPFLSDRFLRTMTCKFKSLGHYCFCLLTSCIISSGTIKSF